VNLPAVSPQAVTPTALLTGEDARAYAKELSESTMVGPFFRGSVPNMLYAMELGKLYDLEPAAVLQNVHIFESVKDGKTTLKAALSANLMVTLARKAGHTVTTTSNPARAQTTIVRGDSIIGKLLKGEVDAEQLAHYATILSTLKDMGVDAQKLATTETFWNEEKAVTAGLFGKGNWAKYPGPMMAARSKSEGVRMACEEVLIQIANRAAVIEMRHGPLTADGQPLQVSWNYTADEMDASVTDDGEFVPGGSSTPKTRTVQQPQREQATVTQIRPTATTDAAIAKADIAAQAAASTAQAGWGKAQPEPAKAPAPEEPKLSEAEVAAQKMAASVRSFVETKTYADVEGILVKKLTEDMPSEDDRKAFVLMIVEPFAEKAADSEQEAAGELLSLYAKVVEHQPDLAEDFLTTVADAAPASRVAEFIQLISLDEETSKDDRVVAVQTIYMHLKSAGRLDDPVSFHHQAENAGKSIDLAGAVKLLVQPIL